MTSHDKRIENKTQINGGDTLLYKYGRKKAKSNEIQEVETVHDEASIQRQTTKKKSIKYSEDIKQNNEYQD